MRKYCDEKGREKGEEHIMMRKDCDEKGREKGRNIL